MWFDGWEGVGGGGGLMDGKGCAVGSRCGLMDEKWWEVV